LIARQRAKMGVGQVLMTDNCSQAGVGLRQRIHHDASENHSQPPAADRRSLIAAASKRFRLSYISPAASEDRLTCSQAVRTLKFVTRRRRQDHCQSAFGYRTGVGSLHLAEEHIAETLV
jgi:hypothetical protein